MKNKRENQEISYLPVRVYYEDTDSGGVVYYANYLKYAERGRTEHLRQAGLENSGLAATDGVFIVVRRLEVDYRAPARLDDLLTVETRVVDLGKASFTMHQNIKRGDDVLVEMTVVLACISASGKPVRMPARLRESLVKEGSSHE